MRPDRPRNIKRLHPPRIILRTDFDIRLDFRMSVYLPIRDNNPFLAVIPPDLRARHGIPILGLQDTHIEWMLATLGEARFLFSHVAARPSAIAAVRAVFADQAGEEARGDGFEGRDGGGQDAYVDLDGGPVHGAADGVGGVAGGEHRGDIGDSDDGGYAGAGGNR